MERIAAAIVTYNPDISKLRANIVAIIMQVEKVVVWDNGSNNINAINSAISGYSTVELFTSEKNKGIAYALNQLCEYCAEKGYEWVLTLDQDSVCPSNLIFSLSKYADKEKVGVVAPKISYRNNEQFYENNTSRNKQEVETVNWVITSASLTNIKGWMEIGGFDNKLFIDKVDYDFCVRLNNRGYSIYRINTVQLIHELGNMECKLINGKVIHVTNHQPFRYYYMARNTIYLKRKLGQGSPISDITKLIIKILLYEDKKWKKMSSIARGLFDARMMWRTA